MELFATQEAAEEAQRRTQENQSRDLETAQRSTQVAEQRAQVLQEETEVLRGKLRTADGQLNVAVREALESSRQLQAKEEQIQTLSTRIGELEATIKRTAADAEFAEQARDAALAERDLTLLETEKAQQENEEMAAARDAAMECAKAAVEEKGDALQQKEEAVEEKVFAVRNVERLTKELLTLEQKLAGAHSEIQRLSEAPESSQDMEKKDATIRRLEEKVADFEGEKLAMQLHICAAWTAAEEADSAASEKVDAARKGKAEIEEWLEMMVDEKSELQDHVATLEAEVTALRAEVEKVGTMPKELRAKEMRVRQLEARIIIMEGEYTRDLHNKGIKLEHTYAVLRRRNGELAELIEENQIVHYKAQVEALEPSVEQLRGQVRLLLQKNRGLENLLALARKAGGLIPVTRQSPQADDADVDAERRRFGSIGNDRKAREKTECELVAE